MKKEYIKLTVVAVIALGIGFFGGMEYKAYQIRSAIDDAFSGVFGEEQDRSTQEKIKSSAVNKLTDKVPLEVVDKGFVEGDFQDYITFTFQFTNATDKDIEGVKGQITFNDLFGDQIQRVNLSYDEGIPAGAVKLYRATVDYNPFIDDDTTLRQTDLSKIKTDWDVNTIIYTDGSQETF